MSVLVTGSSGFIGRHLVRALSGHHVSTYDPAAGDTPSVLSLILQRGCPGGIVHLGAITDTLSTDPEALRKTNVDLPVRLWRYAAKEGVPFVYASSAAVYGRGKWGFDEYDGAREPLNAYARSKLAFDHWAMDPDRRRYRQRAAPAHWAGLRFFNVYGPGEESKGRMASMVSQAVWAYRRNAPLPLFRYGYERRDFVSVFDVVDVILWALRSASEEGFQSGIYNVGSGRAVSFREMAELVECDYRWIDWPDGLPEVYQHYTRARLDRLRAAGYKRRFRSLIRGGLEAYSGEPATV